MSSGYPGFEMSGEGTVYKSNIVDKDEEPLLFYREFYGVASNYVEVSQEFILLNNLRYDRKHKSYFAMYDSGEREEAIKYEDDSTIKIKETFYNRNFVTRPQFTNRTVKICFKTKSHHIICTHIK